MGHASCPLSLNLHQRLRFPCVSSDAHGRAMSGLTARLKEKRQTSKARRGRRAVGHRSSARRITTAVHSISTSGQSRYYQGIKLLLRFYCGSHHMEAGAIFNEEHRNSKRRRGTGGSPKAKRSNAAAGRHPAPCTPVRNPPIVCCNACSTPPSGRLAHGAPPPSSSTLWVRARNVLSPTMCGHDSISSLVRDQHSRWQP